MILSKVVATIVQNEVVPSDRDADEWGDVFSSLPAVDAFEEKKDEVATELAALMSFSELNRSSMADRLNWKKSRVTSVLSGKGNPTLRTIWDFCGVLGYDIDVVFRAHGEPRAIQPWHRSKNNDALSSLPVWETPINLPEITVFVQTGHQVATDVQKGCERPLYLSVKIGAGSSDKTAVGRRLSIESMSSAKETILSFPVINERRAFVVNEK